MNPGNPSTLLSRCMAPLIFDIDSLWPGCSDDAAFFAKNKKRKWRLRNAFLGEWSEFGNAYPSVFVIQLAYGFRLRIGLPVKRVHFLNRDLCSDYHDSEQLAEFCETVESTKYSSAGGSIA